MEIMMDHLKRVLCERINDALYRSEHATDLTQSSILPLKRDELSLDHTWLEFVQTLNVSDETKLEMKDLHLIMNDESTSLKSRFACDVLSDIRMMEESIESYHADVSVVQEEVMSILKQADSEACLVGGAVRDILMDIQPKDVDFVSSLPYDILVSLFEEKGFTVKEQGKQFLVMIVSKEKDGESFDFEIANFRKDGTYTDGRRPDEVSIGTIKEDAARRDFTVNALYYNLRSGYLLDPTARGIQDVQERRLAFVGNPKDRIQEDYLRVFRFYRFLTKGLVADKKSLVACRNMFSEAMCECDNERVRVEIERIVM